MCSGTGIFVQGLMPVMWNVCIPVFWVINIFLLLSSHLYNYNCKKNCPGERRKTVYISEISTLCLWSHFDCTEFI